VVLPAWHSRRFLLADAIEQRWQLGWDYLHGAVEPFLPRFLLAFQSPLSLDVEETV
jgi:hypothetical protein